MPTPNPAAELDLDHLDDAEGEEEELCMFISF